MEIKTLYRYTRPSGGITVSPVKPDGPFTETYRLIAGDGMLLTRDGCTPCPCVDTDSTDGWAEIRDYGPMYSVDTNEPDYLKELMQN